MKASNAMKMALKLEIPITNLDDLERYRNALLSVLRRVNINACDTQFKDDLKTVYALITRMTVADSCTKDSSKEKDELLIIG